MDHGFCKRSLFKDCFLSVGLLFGDLRFEGLRFWGAPLFDTGVLSAFFEGVFFLAVPTEALDPSAFFPSRRSKLNAIRELSLGELEAFACPRLSWLFAFFHAGITG